MSQPPVDILFGTNAATDLHRNVSVVYNFQDQLGVVSAPLKYTIDVDHMKPLGPSVLEVLCRLQRRNLKNHRLLFATSGQADREPVLDFDVGVENHSRCSLNRPFSLKESSFIVLPLAFTDKYPCFFNLGKEE